MTPFDVNKSFDEFWLLYPKKVKKKKAKEKFIKVCKKKEDFTCIIEGLQKYIVSPDWVKDNGQFIPHPTTWLNGEMWNDEIEVKENGKCQGTLKDKQGNKVDQFGNRIYE